MKRLLFFFGCLLSIAGFAVAQTTTYETTASTRGVAVGGTGLTVGTSGGVLGFTGTGTLASSVALTVNRIVLGGGAGATPTVLDSLGTTTTLLHGDAGGPPTFAAVSLTADVSGVLPLANAGSGLNQTATQQITTNGTSVAAGVTQAQPTATITGITTTSACMASVPTALAATWQTGIQMILVVATNTATLQLSNPTAGSITPAGQLVNIKCIL